MVGKSSREAASTLGSKRDLGETSCVGEGKERGNKPALASSLHQTVPPSPQYGAHGGVPRDTLLCDKGLV